MTKPKDHSSKHNPTRSAGKPEIYIYAEGSVTEKNYFDAFKRRGAKSILYRKLGAAPRTLLGRAKKDKKN